MKNIRTYFDYRGRKKIVFNFIFEKMRRWETSKNPGLECMDGAQQTRLTRGKSLDPKNIQAFEQEAFAIISTLGPGKSNSEASLTQSDDIPVFSMENYESESDKKAAEKASKSSKCCCSVTPVKPRHIAPQSSYSVCIYNNVIY